MKQLPFILLTGSALLSSALSGFALGVWSTNHQRITESPLYTALENIGVSVVVDGFTCTEKQDYGLFDKDAKSISLCLTPHDESGYESVISTLRHESFHVLQACYNSKETKFNKSTKQNQGLPSGQGTFFTDKEFQDYFKSSDARQFLGDELYQRVIADYDTDQEKPELEARAAEQFFGDQQIAWWIGYYCQEKS